MTVQKRSRVRRFFGFFLFRIIPTLLIIGIAWSGYRVAQAVAERVGDVVQVNQRKSSYIATATALAPKLFTATPTSSPSPTFTATATSTNTATYAPSATNTLPPTATYTDQPTTTSTFTEMPASKTPTTAPRTALQPSPVAVAAVQFFATNTPQNGGSGSGFAIATNTPAASPTPIVTATNTAASLPTATATLTATLVPTVTETLPPVATASATSRPLPTVLFPENASISEAGGTAVPTIVPVVDRQGYDLINIILLGGDDEVTQDNFVRTDVMIIVSINRNTNTVAMLSLPRDLYVYLPNGTMNRLNLAYAVGENMGWTDGGFGLLRQTILYNFGINVHYYALVNFSGFETVIDTIGGVDIPVDCAYQDWYPNDVIDPNLPVEENYHLRTLDVGYYTMSGFDALWYVRTRKSSDDFDRGRRQQQVLRAIWRKTRDSGQLANFPSIWNDATRIVKTNLGFEDMLGLVPIALSLDVSRIESFTLTRWYHTTPWTTPASDNVQIPNYETVRPLLEDFYQPPTESQIEIAGASIVVYNGTPNESWDRVAAERLAWERFNAVAGGTADNTNYSDTILIDHTGTEKGSSRAEIAKLLNVKPENIISEPDPNRTVDFEVILGSNYNSCTFNVLPPA